MELEVLAQYISIHLPEAWKNCGDQAMEQYRSNWLDRLDFESILDYYNFSEEYYKPRLRQELALLRRDETLNRICWLMHYILFYGEKPDFLNTWGWKGAPKAFADHGSTVTCVVALLAGQPIHVKNMAQRGYDAEQIEIHKKGVRGVWTGQHNTFGMDGISFGYMVWGAYFMRCHLVRLGRLQYEFGLKHFEAYDERFGGDPCYIYIHIPRAENGLQADEVDASVCMAVERLEQYFPQISGKRLVFCTHTWLLSPELREILKPTSNIIRFQDRFTVTELFEEINPFLNFGFRVTAGPDLDYHTLPEDTHLQRELKQRLLRGEKLHAGWGYFTV